VIASYEHASSFGLVVSNEGKKFYNIDPRTIPKSSVSSARLWTIRPTLPGLTRTSTSGGEQGAGASRREGFPGPKQPWNITWTSLKKAQVRSSVYLDRTIPFCDKMAF